MRPMIYFFVIGLVITHYCYAPLTIDSTDIQRVKLIQYETVESFSGTFSKERYPEFCKQCITYQDIAYGTSNDHRYEAKKTSFYNKEGTYTTTYATNLLCPRTPAPHYIPVEIDNTQEQFEIISDSFKLRYPPEIAYCMKFLIDVAAITKNPIIERYRYTGFLMNNRFFVAACDPASLPAQPWTYVIGIAPEGHNPKSEGFYVQNANYTKAQFDIIKNEFEKRTKQDVDSMEQKK